MNGFKRFFSIAFALLLVTSSASGLQSETPAYTVACVGDSLTYGTGSTNRATECWPAVLGSLDGDLDLETMNYGVYGSTASYFRFNSYENTPSYYKSMNSDADVILVMLGSNDSVLPDWRRTLSNSYRELLKTYMNLPQSPTVVVLLPPDLYYTNFMSYTNNEIREVRKVEAAVANELGLSVIDMSSVSGSMASYCVDGGHYNSEGYAIFANYIYDQLCTILGSGKLSAA